MLSSSSGACAGAAIGAAAAEAALFPVGGLKTRAVFALIRSRRPLAANEGIHCAYFQQYQQCSTSTATVYGKRLQCTYKSVVRLLHTARVFGTLCEALPALPATLSPMRYNSSLSRHAVDLCSLHGSRHALRIEGVVRLGDAGGSSFTSRASSPSDTAALRIDRGG